MKGCEPVGEQLNLLAADPGVVYAPKLLVREYGDEWPVVQGEDKVAEVEEEKFTLVHSPGGSLGLSLYGSIILWQNLLPMYTVCHPSKQHPGFILSHLQCF